MPTYLILNIALAAALVIAILVGSFIILRSHIQLRRTRSRFMGVLDAVGIGVLLLREDGTVQYSNSVGTDILRRPPSEIIGKHAHRLLHEEAAIDQPGRPCAFQLALREHLPYRAQERFADGYGRVIPVTVTGLPLAEDRQQAVIAFKDRSTELAQGQQREEAFALISHEIRSPLTALVGYSARLRAAVLSGAVQVDERRAEEITLLAREASRMREIILLILGMAEVEGGRVDVEIEPVRIPQLLQSEADRIRLDLPTSQFHINAEDVVVESDERYLRRILHNLLENAAKYGGDAQPVDVKVTSTEDGGCRIDVTDHGQGIPFDAQPRIFERFYRHESAAAHGRGIGLGLYLSRQLATRLGGHLTFVSTPGQGATFTLTLPAVAPDVPTQRSGPSNANALFPLEPSTRN